MKHKNCVCPGKSLEVDSHRSGLALRHGPIFHLIGLVSGIDLGPYSISQLNEWAYWAD